MIRRKLGVLVVVALAASVIALPAGAQAHNGSHEDNEYVLVTQRLDWHSANAAARQMVADGCQSAHLATITSQAEQAIVTALVNGEGDIAWIGGFQGGPTLSDNWHWVSGEKFDFTKWAGGEPNDTPFGDLDPGSEQHLQVLPDTAPGNWNDAPGFEENYFVVESRHCG